MTDKVYLERPDLFKPTIIQPNAHKIGKIILERGKILNDTNNDSVISVIIRTKNDEVGLERWLNHIAHEKQNRDGRIDTIIVDTESSDRTIELAKNFGATIVRLSQAKFNYPDSINYGMNATSKDTDLAFITVGHAQPVLSNCLQAAASHFKDERVSGVFGTTITSEQASILEKLLFNPTKKRLAPYLIKKVTMGDMAATGCMLRKSVWQAHPIDQRFGAGGEDTEWARQALRRKEHIIYEPAASVHHSHGLGFMDFIKQYKYWLYVINGPHNFKEELLKKYRSDLFRK